MPAWPHISHMRTTGRIPHTVEQRFLISKRIAGPLFRKLLNTVKYSRSPEHVWKQGQVINYNDYVCSFFFKNVVCFLFSNFCVQILRKWRDKNVMYSVTLVMNQLANCCVLVCPCEKSIGCWLIQVRRVVFILPSLSFPTGTIKRN